MNDKTELSIGALAFTTLLLAASIAVFTGAAGASNHTAQYYNNSTTEIGNETWMQGRENATLDNTTNFLTRLGPFVIGDTGGRAASSLATGLLVGGFVIAAVGGTGVGLVAGSVLGMGTVMALIETGYAPGWLYVVILMVLGLVAAPTLIRIYK